MRVDERVVRVYFEMNGFFVRSAVMPTSKSAPKIGTDPVSFWVLNPAAKAQVQRPELLLFATQLPLVQQANVVLKDWRSSHLPLSGARGSAAIVRFLEKNIVKQAPGLFAAEATPFANAANTAALLKILVIPAFPTQEPYKAKLLELLTEAKVDAALSFRSTLQAVVDAVGSGWRSADSEAMETLALLKSYDMIQSPQLELFGGKH